MRVLHYYEKDDAMVCQYVKALCDSMGKATENHLATDPNNARVLMQGSHYDILHLHGCWQNSIRTVSNIALKSGLRIVVTPHGQLEPWVMQENRWKEKLPKQLLFLRRLIRNAYAIVVQGKMEQDYMQRLGWNPRVVIIRNSIITSLTTPKDMSRQTQALYQKVMDSNPLQLLQDDMRHALKAIIKAGITQDQRWLAKDEMPTAAICQWRELLNYAHQEQIRNTVRQGIRALELEAPDIDVEHIDYFTPEDFQAAKGIGTTIGNQFPTENERLIATFQYLRKLAANRQLSIRHLIELDIELRQHDCQENLLREALEERHLDKLAARLMQLMSELTGLTEGFMPIRPLNDRTTRKLRKQIDNHLTI